MGDLFPFCGFSHGDPDDVELHFCEGHDGSCDEGFFLGSMIMVRELTQVWGLGLTIERDTVHGQGELGCLPDVDWNFRYHNLPTQPAKYTAFSPMISRYG
jgi:hypothetical protein